MKKIGLTIACLMFAVIGAACGGDDGGGGAEDGGGDADLAAFCTEVEDFKNTVADPDVSIEELAEGAQTLADTAPEEIAGAADEMATASRAAADGDESVLDAMEQAETEVATYAEENC